MCIIYCTQYITKLQNVLIILALSHARGACRRNNITGVMWSHEDLHMMMILTRGPTCAYSSAVGADNTAGILSFYWTAHCRLQSVGASVNFTTVCCAIASVCNLVPTRTEHEHEWTSQQGPCNVNYVRTPVTQKCHVLTHKLLFPLLCISAHWMALVQSKCLVRSHLTDGGWMTKVSAAAETLNARRICFNTNSR